MPKIRLPSNGWKPRGYQRPAWEAWERGIKRTLLIWHRRAGKDDLSLHKAAVAAHQRIANYWHCLPMYEQARKAIWEAINPHTGRRRINEAFPVELRKRTDNSSMTIEFLSGSIWKVVGSDNPDSLVGAPPAGIVFSEWALANPSSWGYLAPILDENGGWADFITTPRGRNHVHTMLDMARKSPDWFAEVLTVADTGYPLERVEKQREEYHSIFGQEAGDALIEQEYWCSFEAAILGAYWAKEMVRAEQEGRITADLEYEPVAPVHTAWDLGVGDSTAIWWFQCVGPKVYVLDYYETHGYGAAHYCDVVKNRTWWSEGSIAFVPHDAKVREWAGETKPDGKAKQRIEVLMAAQVNPRLVALHKVEDGINAARQVLPKCWFDADRCKDGLECLRQYQAEWDDDKKCFSDRPLHNWTVHGADAFRYLAMAHREIAPSPAAKPGRVVETPRGPKFIPDVIKEEPTLDRLWELHGRRQAGGRI